MKIRDITIFILGLTLDLLSKYIISIKLSLNESITIINNFFYLNYVQNTGAAWSMLSNKTWLLTIISIVVSLILIYYYCQCYKNKDSLTCLCISLMLTGAIGNLYDRLVLGYVRDFLSFNIFGYMFPVFNIADSLLVIGGFLWLIMTLIKESRGY